MEVVKNYDDNELIVSVEGRVDTITSNDLEKELNDEMGNFKSLIFDFLDLEYISSAGLRLLISTQKKLKSDDVPMKIVNVNDTIGEIFRISGFDKILTIE